MSRRRLLAAGQIAVGDRSNGAPGTGELGWHQRRGIGPFTAAGAACRRGWPASRRLALLAVRAGGQS
jgi:hypothetical protein